jgi:[ribosomal protein S5]-alanine N-acetyltransferase
MLIGTKICLGPILQADGMVIFRWRNTPGVMLMDGMYSPISQGNFDEWFTAIGKDPTRIVFSIRKPGSLEFLGYVQIADIHPVFRSAELGIMIGDAANRGKGYGPDALRLCIAFCWNELNLQRLSLKIIGDNPRAIRAYEKAGFEREGLLQRATYRDGDFRDTTLMALLRPDRIRHDYFAAAISTGPVLAPVRANIHA